MAWNPDIYNKFKSERFAPFYDLLHLVQVKPGLEVIDLGCGTGELTGKLAQVLPESNVLGIDSSQEMLDDSLPFTNANVQFVWKSIEEQLASGSTWDLIFSNAAVQWVDNHEMLFPKIISCIKPGGQLAIQIPAQHHNVSNKLLDDLADEEPFRTALNGWKRTSPLLDTDDYAQLLFENGGKEIAVFEKIYPLLLPDSDALFEWVSGTALIPYLERLPEDSAEIFKDAYKILLKSMFQKSPVFYPFKRILMSAVF